MQEEQAAMQKAQMERMMRRGGTDPWAVEFNKDLAGKDIADPTETLKDSAVDNVLDKVKSFSF